MDWVETASILKDVLVGILIILSMALTTIGALAWRRKRATRLLWVTIAFALFLVKGISLALGLYVLGMISVPRGFAGTFDLMLILDVLILVILYLALFRRTG